MGKLNWVAILKDGTVQTEAELDSSEKINRAELAQFRLLNEEGKLIFVYHNNENRKLIFRRRTYLSALNVVMGTVYLVGWHENVKGVSVKSICYIYEDGHIEFDDDRNDLELVPCEI